MVVPPALSFVTMTVLKNCIRLYSIKMYVFLTIIDKYDSIIVDKTMVFIIPYFKPIVYLVNIFYYLTNSRDEFNCVSLILLYWRGNSIQKLFLKGAM